MIEILLGILILLVFVNMFIALRKKGSVNAGPMLKELLEKSERTQKDEFERNRRENQEIAKTNREELTRSLRSFEEKFASNIKELNELIRQKFGDFNKQQIDNNKLATDHMKGIQETIEKQLLSIRDDNTKQLNEMRKTVDDPGA